MKIKYTYIIVGVLIVISIVLAYDAFTSYIDPYLSVSEIAENNPTYVNQTVQVLGTVVNGSRRWADDGSLLFNLTDNNYVIEVSYEGSSPPNFNEGEQVVVIGELVSQHHFNASEMLVPCASRYEGGETSMLSNPVFLVTIIIGSAALIYYVVFVILRKT